MKIKSALIGLGAAVCLTALATAAVTSSDAKYSVKVPNGLSFSEFRGYEGWEAISISQNGPVIALILGNPEMIKAFKSGTPDNGKPFPDGAKMAKIHWEPVKNDKAPGSPMVAGPLHDVDFMVKDSRKFADSGGWGYAAFKYDGESDNFSPVDLTGMPPQANDAKCGAACHTIAKDRDYVFTRYARR